MILSILPFGRVTLSILPIGKVTLGIMPFSRVTLSIMGLLVTIGIFNVFMLSFDFLFLG